MSTASATPEKKNTTTGFIVGLVVILLGAFLVAELDAGISAWFKAQGFGKNPFECLSHA